MLDLVEEGSPLAEIFKVLKPAARLCVADLAATGELPMGIRRVAAVHVGCVAGAMPLPAHLELLRAMGFDHVCVAEIKPITLPDEALAKHLMLRRRHSARQPG